MQDLLTVEQRNTRRLAKIHKLKRVNKVLCARRKAILQCKEHYNNAKYHYYCKDDFKALFSISEKIGKNSAKIERLRTLISQDKAWENHPTLLDPRKIVYVE